MNSSGMILLLSLTFLGCLTLIGLLSLMWMRSWQNQSQNQITILTNLLLTSQKEKTELLNRMMSSDLPTFAMLNSTTSNSTTSSTFSEYTPRDDATEVERLTSLGGFGAALYEEDAQSLASDLAELGLYVNPSDQ